MKLSRAPTDEEKFENLCRMLDAAEADALAANPQDRPIFEHGCLQTFRNLKRKWEELGEMKGKTK